MGARRKINASAREKLGEARFFFSMMEKAVGSDAFVYFLSAFLSALCSVTAPVKLQPRQGIDERYRAWKREMDEGLLKDAGLALLSQMRNGEVHNVPVEKLQSIGASFPGGLDLSAAGSYIELDLSSGRAVGRQKVGDAPVETHPIIVSWRFDAAGDPDVLETCRAGLAVVEQVLASHTAMQFDEEESPSVRVATKQPVGKRAKTNMDSTKFANKSGFGNTISLPGKLALSPDMTHGAQPFTLGSFAVAGGLSSSAVSKGVHIRLHFAEQPDLFIMLNLEAADARAFAAALTREAGKS